jgi:HK97 family phage major capsid protein
MEAQMLTQDEIKELTHRKDILVMLCRQSNDKAFAEHRNMTKEEQTFFDEAMKNIKMIRTDLGITDESDEKRTDAFLSTLVAARGQIGNGPEVADANSKFLTRNQKVADTAAYQGNGEVLDPARAIRGQITGNWSGADAERRAMEGVGSTGGFLLTPQMSGILVDLARNQSVCVQAGAITALMDTSEMIIGKVATEPTAAWISEGGTITPAAITFGKVTLKATVLAAMCKVSIQLATDASNIDSLIRTALSGAIGTELDRAALMGSGVAEPRGLFYTPDVQSYSLGANGASIANFDAFSFGVQYVQNENGQPTGVIMSPRTAGAIDRLKEATTNAPLTPPASYAALSKYVTKQIPDTLIHGTSTVASAAIVGNFSQIVMGLAPSEGGLRGIRIDVSREAAFDTLELLIRAYIRADIAILRPRWFTTIKGILA